MGERHTLRNCIAELFGVVGVVAADSDDLTCQCCTSRRAVRTKVLHAQTLWKRSCEGHGCCLFIGWRPVDEGSRFIRRRGLLTLRPVLTKLAIVSIALYCCGEVVMRDLYVVGWVSIYLTTV
jgi:hypothetical protein